MSTSTEKVDDGAGERICYSREVMLRLSEEPLSRRCPAVLEKNNNGDAWRRKVIRGADSEAVSANEERPRVPRGMDSDFNLLPQRRSFVTGCRQQSTVAPVATQKQKIIGTSLTGKDSPGKELTREIYRDLDLVNKNYNVGPTITRNFSNTRPNSNQSYRNYGYNNNQNDRDNSRYRGNQNDHTGGRRDRLDPSRDSGSFDRPYSDDRKVDLRSFHHQEEEVEPEWMTEGPKSRHDVIELRGFDDDVAEGEGGDFFGLDSGDKKADADRTASSDAAAKSGSTDVIDESKPVFVVTENGLERRMGKPAEETAPDRTRNQVAESVPAVNIENQSLASQTNRGAGSRFSAFFNTKNSEPEQNHPNMSPEVDGVYPSQHQPPATQPSEVGTGQSILRMLRKNENQNNQIQNATFLDFQPNISTPGTFKTVEDVEREQFFGDQQRLANNPQIPPPNYPFMIQEIGPSAPPPPPPPQFPRQPVPASYSHMPTSSPSLSSHHWVDLNAAGIPNDPSLHKLLGLSQHELTGMRDAGHFDQATLLSLLQMKQKKEAILSMVAAQQRSPQSHLFPMRDVRPQSLPTGAPMMAPHPHHRPVRLPNGPIFGDKNAGRPFPNMPQQAQHFPLHPIQQHLANQEKLALWTSMNSQMPMHPQRSSIEDTRSQMQSTVLTSVSRPSPLLPTSVMRKTVQRADSAAHSPTLSSPDANQPFPSHLLAASGDRSREREREEEERRMLFAQQQQQQALQQHRLAMHNQQQMARTGNPYSQHSPLHIYNSNRYPPMSDANLHYPSFRNTSSIREALGGGFDMHNPEDFDYNRQQQH